MHDSHLAWCKSMTWHCSLLKWNLWICKTHMHTLTHTASTFLVGNENALRTRTHSSFICTLHVENLMVTSHFLHTISHRLIHIPNTFTERNANSYWVQFNRMLVGCFNQIASDFPLQMDYLRDVHIYTRWTTETQVVDILQIGGIAMGVLSKTLATTLTTRHSARPQKIGCSQS